MSCHKRQRLEGGEVKERESNVVSLNPSLRVCFLVMVVAWKHFPRGIESALSLTAPKRM